MLTYFKGLLGINLISLKQDFRVVSSLKISLDSTLHEDDEALPFLDGF